MPKVPEYVSSQQVPGNAPFGEASPAVLAGPAEALTRGAQITEAAGLQALRHVQYMEAEKARQDRSDATVKAQGVAHERIIQAANDLLIGKVDETGTVTEAPATSSDYYPRLKQKIAEITQDVAGQEKDQFIAAGVRKGLDQVINLHQIEGLHFARRMYVNEQNALIGTQMHQAMRNYSKEQDPILKAAVMEDFNAWVKTKVPTVGAQVVEQRLLQAQNEFAKTDANGEIDRTGTYSRETYVDRLDPLTLDMLDRRAMVVADKRNREAERKLNEARRTGYSDLTDLILEGRNPITKMPVTLDEIRATDQWQLLEGAQKQTLARMLVDPKPNPSDAATRRMVLEAVDRDKPTMTEQQVRDIANRKDASGVPLLNDADEAMMLTRVRERNDYWRSIGRADEHRAEDKVLADKHRRYSEVRDIGIGALSLTGSIAERLDPKAQELKAIWQEALLRDSNGAGTPIRGMPRDKESEDIMYTVLPGLMVRLADGVQDDYQKQQRIIDLSRYKTPAQLQEAYRGRENDPTYLQEARRFRDLQSAKKQYDSLQLMIEQRRVEAAKRQAK